MWNLKPLPTHTPRKLTDNRWLVARCSSLGMGETGELTFFNLNKLNKKKKKTVARSRKCYINRGWESKKTDQNEKIKNWAFE